MNKAIAFLVLIISPQIFAHPQYSEDIYRRQYEEPETPETPEADDGSYGYYQKRIPVAPERRPKPFARVQKVTPPQIPTAAPQQERYRRPLPQVPVVPQENAYNRPQPQPQPQPQLQLPILPIQDERYNRPQPQLPILPVQDERYNRPQPQLPAYPAQEENYNRPQPQFITFPAQEETYNRQQTQAPTAAPQEERYSKPQIPIHKFSVQEEKYNKPVDERYSTPIPIIKFDKEQSLDGSYKHSYETGNNIIAEESGYIKNLGVKDQEALVQQGSFSYTAPDGTIINTSYTADESGFRVEGSHIPTPPPVPEEIRKSLETIYEGIRQQQEAEAKEAKYGKNRPVSAEETNSISDNYNYPNYS